MAHNIFSKSVSLNWEKKEKGLMKKVEKALLGVVINFRLNNNE